MFIFAGIMSFYAADHYEQRVRIMFHIDHEAQLIRVQAEDLPHTDFTVQQLVDLFQPKLRNAAGLLSHWSESSQGAEPSDDPALLAGLVGIGPDTFGNARIKLEAPGIADILSSKHCDSPDFRPVGKTVVDFGANDFSDVRFINTDFSPTNMSQVTLFSRSTFEGCRFAPSQLKGKNLAGARIVKQAFSNLDLQDTVFDGADLEETVFSHCSFNDALFKNAKLSQTSFIDSTFTRTRFDGSSGTLSVFLDSDLTFANFSEAKLRVPIFLNSTLTSVSFKNAELIDGKFGEWGKSATLHKTDFTNVSAQGARFAGARITETDFTKAKLDNAIFSGTALSQVSFKGTELTEANFGPLDSRGPRDGGQPGATISGTDFAGAKLRKTIFSGTALSQVSFKDADLAGANFGSLANHATATFDDVDLDNADLLGVNLSGTLLTGKVRHTRLPKLGRSLETRTCLKGATFKSGLLGTNWSYVDATDAKITVELADSVENFSAKHALLPALSLANKALPDADFTSAHLKEVRFANCDLNGAKFNGAMLESTEFSNANLEDVTFDNANLMGSIFTKAWLWGAQFRSTVLTGTTFASAMLAEVNFSGIQGRKLAGMDFSGACLVSANFSNVTVIRDGARRTNFSNACLAGTDFNSASLADAVLSNAQVSSKAGIIAVTHRDLKKEKSFDYIASKLSTNSTGPSTTCPDGNPGACSLEQLYAKPVPQKWQV